MSWRYWTVAAGVGGAAARPSSRLHQKFWHIFMCCLKDLPSNQHNLQLYCLQHFFELTCTGGSVPQPLPLTASRADPRPVTAYTRPSPRMVEETCGPIRAEHGLLSTNHSSPGPGTGGSAAPPPRSPHGGPPCPPRTTRPGDKIIIKFIFHQLMPDDFNC